ncbi:MAG: penicillin-binding transpeptidase domain-containing protein, partial [Myxococcota bacterium]
HTGDILALATSTRDAPHFNPNRRRDYELKDFRNRAITDPFEPGSTFKPFVLASALQEGVVDVNEMIDVEGGVLKLGDYTIYDIYRFRRLKARDVVKYSSNIGAYKIAKRLGKHKFGDYMRAFGFGQRTDIAVGGEARGLLGNTHRWDDRILASGAYGYGLMATNLQLNMALGAIANGGVLMKPRLVREVRDRDGTVLETFGAVARHRVLDAKVAAEIRKVMEGVIEHGGTGTRAALAYHRVAGKTGTARKVNPRTKRYDKSRIVGSFIGMAPADDPALVITIVIDQPTFGRGGGEVAAPVFKRIAEQALPVVNVYPPADKYTSIKARVEKEREREERRNRRRRLVERDERIFTRERPDRDWKVPAFHNGITAPELNTSLEPMPSYIGMSLREVLRHSRELGHLVDVRGAGIVTRQWPGPGVFVNPDVEVQVWLEGR